jgi:hypothetical protein
MEASLIHQNSITEPLYGLGNVLQLVENKKFWPKEEGKAGEGEGAIGKGRGLNVGARYHSCHEMMQKGLN